MKRVRVQGDLWHGRVPEGAVYIGRAAPGLKRSPFANPFSLKKHGEAALRLYAEHLDAHPELVEQARRELAGKDLACWCPLDQACHGDELLRRIGPPPEFRLCNRNHLGLFLGILLKTGAICPKCGHGTRVTSKRWARCKKCNERVERQALPSDADIRRAGGPDR